MNRQENDSSSSTSTPPPGPSRRDVWSMFDRIAGRYDFLNHFLSANRDKRWRSKVAACLPRGDSLRVLDLATGTADQLLALYDSGRVASGIGADMAEKMLAIGREKIAARQLGDRLTLQTADAHHLPFEDTSVDAVTISFGIRNMHDVSRALHEMYRVLKSGGRAIILEFSLPKSRVFRRVYLFYLRHILPHLGKAISGDNAAYRYLNETIETFPHGEDFCALMRTAGFVNVSATPLTLGIASIYQGDRRPIVGPTASRHDEVRSLNEATALLAEQAAALLNEPHVWHSRLAVGVPETDILNWLRTQPATTKAYWRSRDERFEIAALGAVHTISGDIESRLYHDLSHMRQSLNAELRYLGGARFDLAAPNRRRDSNWGSFGGYRFVLPRVELVRQGDKTELAFNYYSDRKSDNASTIELLRSLTTPPARIDPEAVTLGDCTNLPDKLRWRQAVVRALHLFRTTELTKLVLARRSDFSSAQPIDPWQVLALLRKTAPGCTLFGFCFDSDTVFLGATPERLYAREGRQIHTEALAGTRPRGNDAACDEDLEVELRTSEKERREHGHVVESVIAGLTPLAKSVTAEEQPTVLKLSSVQHLKTPIEAKLRVKVTDATLIEALHPTAAVNGEPRDLAQKHLRELEPFDRGWYAGPVGWISREAAEFAVAIRSGLICRNQLSLFAGAGIVEGSSPDAEWAELDNKLSAFLQAITGTTGPGEAE